MITNLITLLLVIIFGVVCSQSPMTIIGFLMWWIRPTFIEKKLYDHFSNPKLQELIILYNQDPEKYQLVHYKQIKTIRFSGYFALIWATLLLCSLWVTRQ